MILQPKSIIHRPLAPRQLDTSVAPSLETSLAPALEQVPSPEPKPLFSSSNRITVLVDGLPSEMSSELLTRLSRHPHVGAVVIGTTNSTDDAGRANTDRPHPNSFDLVIHGSNTLSTTAWTAVASGARLIRCPESIVAEEIDDETLGLPEVNRSAIQVARRVRNPGPLATAVGLAVAPLRKTAPESLLRLDDQCPANLELGYGPEDSAVARRILNDETALPKADVFLSELDLDSEDVFKATILFDAIPEIQPLESLFSDRFEDELFVEVVDGDPKELVPGRSNHAYLSIDPIRVRNQLAITCAFDPVVRGGAGQIVHNMNVMFGFPESAGLELWPAA